MTTATDGFSGLVSSRTLPLGELLEVGEFRVPVNQRPWSWRVEHVQRLLADLDETFRGYYEPSSSGFRVRRGRHLPHFLGAVVVFHEAEGRPLEIVDGQQRLTVVVMLACALDEAASRSRTSPTAAQRRHLNTLRATFRSITGTPLAPRLQLDREFHDFYKEYVLEPREAAQRASVMRRWAPTGMSTFNRERPVQSNLKKASDACRSWVDRSLAGMSDALQVSWLRAMTQAFLTQMQCLLVTVTDYSYGLAVFRGLNSTGRGLDHADNIKNELFRQSERVDADGLRETYVRTLLSLPARDINNFLRLRQVAMFGPTPKNRLYDLVVERELLGGDVKEVAERWRKDAELVHSFVHPAGMGFTVETTRLLEDIETLDVSYSWSLLIAAAHRFLPTDTDSFNRCVKLARDFAFRVLTVRRSRDVSGLEDGYSAAAALLRNGAALSAVVTSLRDASDDVTFKQEFSTYVEQRRKVQYYVLFELERALNPGSPLQPSDLNTTVDIEHILPQRFSREAPGDWLPWRKEDGSPSATHANYVSRIGNLLILDKSINSVMNSGSYEAKAYGRYSPALRTLPDGSLRPTFRSTELRLPRLLVDQGYADWGPEEVDAWQALLADHALKIWDL